MNIDNKNTKCNKIISKNRPNYQLNINVNLKFILEIQC